VIPELVTFDCAQTIIQVRWTVEGFARDCAQHVGIDLPDEAYSDYRRAYFERLPEFLALNLRRDPAEGAEFWRRLAGDWLERHGLSRHKATALWEASERLGFGPDSILFSPYADVVPCLDQLKTMGVRVAVVSNWDYSLHRVLGMFGLHERFELVLASLEEGVEKPDPRLFEICLDRLGVSPDRALHVGDDPIDDLGGATAAGMRALLIDRERDQSGDRVLASLTHLPEAFAWTR